MAKQENKQTGLGADAFFQSAPTTTRPTAQSKPPSNPNPEERSERRSFNLKPSTLRILDEIQIKTIREGKKSTLSAIIEQGIALAAKEKGAGE